MIRLDTRTLAAAELSLRAARETEHARRAMRRLSLAKHDDRIKRGGRTERATAVYWRRAKRHMRNAGRARALLALLGVSQ